ncbi:MAG: single-stranded-DNA-specific exonuclease RecJ [Acutalibacteraceae bacterium]|nr:single-stranded-DNA-specific exonuclease RecJ [Acutalibacteraceae bacterium]
MGFKKWAVADYDKELAKELAAECDVDPIVALIASSRGYDNPTDLEQFLSDEPVFSDPRHTADIIIAAEIVNAAIEDGVKIAVYGDYDCDGVTATALLYNYLTSRNADCIYYIPDRFNEGYGMNEEAVKKLYSEGVKLIITVDNGISAIKEIQLAKSLGMDVVVTDHHLPGDVLPNADAVVDPHRKDCPSAFKEICGAQVAFRLICVMENKEPEELLPYFADILSLAVVGDIMPLTAENRSIVKYGVEKLKTAPVTGLSALMSVAGLDKKSLDATKIAFGLTPRINASGRMGDAKRAVELLVSQNMMSALGIANEIDSDNSIRQQTEKKILAEVLNQIEEKGYENQRVIVCSGYDWHAGVIGIVAARVAERYSKPAIMITVDNEGSAHGSGRGVEGFSLYDAINHCKDLLTKFGGHEQAAGISLKGENIDIFREKINNYADDLEYTAPTLHIDCRLNPTALTVDLATAIKSLEPFGTKNPPPVFGLWGVTLTRITPIGGGKHLRMLFTKGNNTFSALLFGVSPDTFCFDEGDVLDLAVSVQENEFKGEIGVSVIIRAMRINGTDDDKLFRELFLWEDYLSEKDEDYTSIAPNRQEIGLIYKYVCQNNQLTDKVKYHFINSLGIGKTLASTKILEELGLLRKENDMLIGIKTGEKTELEKSITYLKLQKGGNIV